MQGDSDSKTESGDTAANRAHLETRVIDYVRAGWTVVDQTGVRANLHKGDQALHLQLDDRGQILVEGPALPMFYVDGRLKAWLYLLATGVVVLVIAWLLGFFH